MDTINGDALVEWLHIEYGTATANRPDDDNNFGKHAVWVMLVVDDDDEVVAFPLQDRLKPETYEHEPYVLLLRANELVQGVVGGGGGSCSTSVTSVDVEDGKLTLAAEDYLLSGEAADEALTAEDCSLSGKAADEALAAALPLSEQSSAVSASSAASPLSK